MGGLENFFEVERGKIDMLIKVPKYAVVAVAIALPVTAALYLGTHMLCREYSDRMLYPEYMESLKLEPGDVGTAPTADTPAAFSTEEFSELDTFYTEGRLRDSYDIIDGKLYYELDLENGENVLVRVDWDTTEILEPYLRRMPVGRWVELTSEQMEQIQLSYLTVTDHYVDMMGDFDRIKTEGEFFTELPMYRVLSSAMPIFFVVLYIALCIVFRKRSIVKRNRQSNYQDIV